MNEVALIAGMALVTFAVRYPVLAIVGRLRLPANVLRALRYVPTAVLTAIIFPAVLAPGNVINLSLTNAYLIAGLVSGAIAWYTRKLLPTIGIGMIFFLIWRVLFPV